MTASTLNPLPGDLPNSPLHRGSSQASLLKAILVLLVSLSPLSLVADDYDPMIAGPSQEGKNAIQGFVIPEGMKVELVAAEPLLANPVSFCFDEFGRIFVCETFRQEKGVEDNRKHMYWLHDDLALQTVEERLVMFRKHLGDKVLEYGKEHDRIRLLIDSDGDRIYDDSKVYADGFNGILDGTGSGILARGGKVYYTCIPKFWMFQDTDGDGKADIRNPLHHGYGVRVAFRGHDSHGLRMGPDGRIYFSIGDRGYNIEFEGKRLARPETGAVFRCNPDGSELEVFAYGFRNPQELAFDDYGNLFTGDNNSDSGDRARWVYVVDGADIGWRMFYQYLNDRGPWNREKLWHPSHEGQPAYIVPPVINIADGPSGLTYYPGVGLPDRYKGHFFLCDFRGGAGGSGIRSFAVENNGATFSLVDSHEFLWRTLVTDVEFGPDGQMYFSDWVDGWSGLGKGRIYRVNSVDESKLKDQLATATLVAQGIHNQEPAELVQLLGHADQRVRQEAQFALAALGQSSIDHFRSVLKDRSKLFPRLHAVWGLGQIERANRKSSLSFEIVKTLFDYLEDDELEVRAQVCRVLGDSGSTNERVALLLETRITSDEPRVQSLAMLALARLNQVPPIEQTLALLESNKDKDPVLRHAAIRVLESLGTKEPEKLLSLRAHPIPSVRRGVAVALRRLRHEGLIQMLSDTDPLVLEEVVRAIYDEPIASGWSALASLASRTELTEPVLRRVAGACEHTGDATGVALIASRSDVPEAVRLQALSALASWPDPSPLDRVIGDYRPIAKRDSAAAKVALLRAIGPILSGSDALREEGAKAAATLGIPEVAPALMSLLIESSTPEVRVASLQGIVAIKAPQSDQAIDLALKDVSGIVRAAALKYYAQSKPDQALVVLDSSIKSGSRIEQQAAIGVLAEMNRPESDERLVKALDELIAGKTPAALRLDLLEAASKRDHPQIKERVVKYESAKKQDDPLSLYQEVLEGGNATRGAKLFFERGSLSCVRCHKVGDRGGEVGPDLSKISNEKKRDYLLESILLPNNQIAKGFETIIVETSDGLSQAGIVKQETKGSIELLTAEGKLVNISKGTIEEQTKGKSSMPEDLTKYLTKTELRDLIEFLAGLKEAPKPEPRPGNCCFFPDGEGN